MISRSGSAQDATEHAGSRWSLGVDCVVVVPLCRAQAGALTGRDEDTKGRGCHCSVFPTASHPASVQRWTRTGQTYVTSSVDGAGRD